MKETDMPAPQPTRSLLYIVLDLALQIVLAIAIGVAASVTFGTAVLLLAGTAQAAAPREPAPGSGELMLRAADGKTAPAPLLATEVEIRVTGLIARATVRQVFRNPHRDWFEGVYVFPLPENAAVDHLRMKIGERIVEGEIRERGAAKAVYDEAKAQGRRAALLEQERPNIFTSSVANIGPGEEIRVEIEYQQTLRFDQSRYSLRFPMVVGPRYIPGETAAGAMLRTGTGRAADTTVVPDASRITPPVPRPGEATAQLNPIRLRVSLDAGVPIGELKSAYHAVNVESPAAARREIELAGEQVANKDFELSWTLAPGEAPAAAVFSERSGNLDYGLVLVVPPAAATRKPALPRDAIFVIDTSGSMHGSSIAQAKEALELALRRLGPADRFNVIEFNSYARALFPEERAASAETIDSAVHWVRELRAQGGTEMMKALELALDGKEHPRRVRQVIFLTDGAVGNEDQIFSFIQQRLGDSRLFTVGIGSAPNSHFMVKAARAGAGTFTYIGKIDEVKEKMSALFARLESPVLKNLRLQWSGGREVESWPRVLPDLYLGEPVVVLFAAKRAPQSVELSGLAGDAPWSTGLSLREAGRESGLGVLWAGQKISGLIDTLREGAREEDVKGAVIRLALDHHLVSKYTSLVAVDKTSARRPGDPLKTAPMPTQLPEGWNHEAVFGELPRGATDARVNLLVGMLLVAAALLVRLHARRSA